MRKRGERGDKAREREGRGKGEAKQGGGSGREQGKRE